MWPMPRQEPFDADPGLGPGQQHPGTRVGVRVRRRDARGRSDSPHGSRQGSSKWRGSRPAAPFRHHDRGPGRDLDTAHRARRATTGGSPLSPALHPEALLDEIGNEGAVLPQQLLQIVALADQLERGGEQPHGRLLPRREHIGGHPDDVDHLGHRPVGKGGGRQAVQYVVARRATPVLDVCRQLVVEELERRVAERPRPRAPERLACVGGLACSSSRNQFVVGLGNAPGDRRSRKERERNRRSHLMSSHSPRAHETRRSGGQPAAT